MTKTFLTDCAEGDALLYSLYSYNGHIVRVDEAGRISRADDADKRAAAWAAECLRKWGRPQ